jgi:RNA polymerase sigma factor (sigma-70 family)
MGINTEQIEKIVISFGLSAYDSAALKDIFSRDITYVDDPAFHENDAGIKIFQNNVEVPNAPRWKDFIDYESFKKNTKVDKKKAILTPEQEITLFQQFNYSRFRVFELKNIEQKAKEPNEQNIKDMLSWHKKSLSYRTKIVEYNLRLIAKMINQFYHYNLDLDELCSEGQNVLLNAIDKFDHLKAKFSTYAYWSMLNAFNKISKERSKRNGVISESLEENEEGQNAIKHESEDAFCIESLNKILEENLANLNDDELKIIRMRYLDNEKRPSVADVGTALDIKKHKVGKFENSAFAKIKRVLERDFLK